MTIYVALLRGVNVGGRTTLKMADLRETAEGCGFTDVTTYVQSGNLVFRSTAKAATVARDLRAAITGAVAVRTRAQLAKVVAANPYTDRAADPTKVHVAFAVEGVTFSSDVGLDVASFAPEELTVTTRETYLYLPNGMGRSKLAQALTKGRRPQDATVRNWRTVTTLLTMTDDLAAP